MSLGSAAHLVGSRSALVRSARTVFAYTVFAGARVTKLNIIRINLCISGFTQDEKRLHGVFRLSEKLHDAGYNNCESRVYLRPWNSDWSALAEHFWLLGQLHNATILINIYAYSWGVGYGAVRLAEELDERGMRINCLVSSDGVYRHRWFRLPSMFGRVGRFSPTIELPANVDEVFCLHQDINRPQGHVINGDGIIHDSIRVQATHQYMDDSDLFHDLSLAAAQQLRDMV